MAQIYRASGRRESALDFKAFLLPFSLSNDAATPRRSVARALRCARDMIPGVGFTVKFDPQHTDQRETPFSHQTRSKQKVVRPHNNTTGAVTGLATALSRELSL